MVGVSEAIIVLLFKPREAALMLRGPIIGENQSCSEIRLRCARKKLLCTAVASPNAAYDSNDEFSRAKKAAIKDTREEQGSSRAGQQQREPAGDLDKTPASDPTMPRIK